MRLRNTDRQTETSENHRRRFLRLLGAASAGTVAAGCLSDLEDDDTDNGNGDDDTSNGTENGLGNGNGESNLIEDTLAIVPLDDRPANIYFPEMTAATADVETRFPPEDQIGFFETPGNGDEIGEWLLSVDDVDGFIISVDMLVYGGLIASRVPEMSQEEAMSNVEVLSELRDEHPDATILVYDTIQRLAPTFLGSDDFDESLLQEWATLVDRVENLGEEEYADDLEDVEEQLPDEVIEDYLDSRERNHEVNRYVIEQLADDKIDYLILGQDDADEVGLHRPEREELLDLIGDLGVDDRVEVFPGADENDTTFVARYVTELFDLTPRVSVEYSGVHGEDWIPVYEDIPYDENIAKHLEVSGAQVVESDPDIHLMVNTPTQEGESRADELDAFVSDIATHLENDDPVIVLDAVEVNAADPELTERMEAEIAVSQLLAFSAWNTAGNALGIATGHGLSRWAFLQESGDYPDVTDLHDPAEAHVNYLLHRLTKDDYWKNVVQPDAYAEGWSMDANVYDLEPDEVEVLEAFVQDELGPFVETYAEDHFVGEPVEFGYSDGELKHGTIDELSTLEISLPWPRLFETILEPELDVSLPE
ncbi:DUF4127 family protein [Halobacteria archaeon AArc-dxtr1]|nr:DUF4127 family protein [Halobacteria archaeon AArc-dxtr1]